MEEMKVYNLMLVYGIATEDELNLVTKIWGMTLETLNKVIFARTGYRDMAQYEESEKKEA